MLTVELQTVELATDRHLPEGQRQTLGSEKIMWGSVELRPSVTAALSGLRVESSGWGVCEPVFLIGLPIVSALRCLF